MTFSMAESSSSKIFERRSLEVNTTEHDKIIVRPDGTHILCDSPNSSELPSYYSDDMKRPSIKKHNNSFHAATKPRRVLGNYTLVSTLGSGSMGKVRLAVHNITGDKLAVKIVPRRLPKSNNSNKKQENDEHREIRTVREASIMMLLHHPFIVSLKEMVILDPYYYLFMEHVNGGQLLDYIISHGKLREKQARRFARQIASALDYCHRNSIVHRDLKIENILISQSGNIKIIDFGLSNLFSPRSSLKTFCGSLYFAAPELLNAKAYTGPEVDVWSFGVVLYVLVCGKVPFDDQSMPALHEKIKRGAVEYPSHLSTDCKSILSRMLVINPSHRATVSEIMVHPWMNRGYDGPIDNYLPDRVPLTLPIDMEVVRGMTGFEFGTETEIRDKLEAIITSDEYQKAAKTLMERTAESHRQQRHGSLVSKFSAHSINKKPLYLPNDDPQSIPAAYHPLVSIYYLVKERQERERRLSQTSNLPGELSEDPLSPIDTNEPDSFLYDRKGKTQTRVEEQPGNMVENGLSRLFSRRRHSAQSNQSSMEDEEYDLHRSTTRESNTSNHVFRRLSHALTRTSAEHNQEKRTRKLSTNNNNNELTSPVSSSTSTPIQIPSRSESPKNDSIHLSKSYAAAPTSQFPNALFTPHKQPPTDVEIATAAAAAAAAMNTSAQNNQNSKFGNKFSKILPRRMTVGQSAANNAESHTQFLNMVRENSDLGLPQPTYHQNTMVQQGGGTADENIKPVFLKGLFSVTTTSTKHPSVIRADLIRVLERIGVKWRESKGRFECVHVPSIDLNHVVNEEEPIVGDQSFSSDEVAASPVVVAVPDLVVRFEIYIVKVPWLLGMHGLQFRRVGGDPWQYKNMCSKILAELKL